MPRPAAKKSRLKAKAVAGRHCFRPGRLQPPFLGSGTCAGPWKRSCPSWTRGCWSKRAGACEPGAKAEQFFAETLQLLQEKGIRRFFCRLRLFCLPPQRQEQPAAGIRRPKRPFLNSPAAKTSLWPIISLQRDDVAPFFIVSCGKALALPGTRTFCCRPVQPLHAPARIRRAAGRNAGRGDACSTSAGNWAWAPEAGQEIQPRFPGLARPGRPAQTRAPARGRHASASR